MRGRERRDERRSGSPNHHRHHFIHHNHHRRRSRSKSPPHNIFNSLFNRHPPSNPTFIYSEPPRPRPPHPHHSFYQDIPSNVYIPQVIPNDHESNSNEFDIPIVEATIINESTNEIRVDKSNTKSLVGILQVNQSGIMFNQWKNEKLVLNYDRKTIDRYIGDQVISSIDLIGLCARAVSSNNANGKEHVFSLHNINNDSNIIILAASYEKEMIDWITTINSINL